MSRRFNFGLLGPHGPVTYPTTTLSVLAGCYVGDNPSLVAAFESYVGRTMDLYQVPCDMQNWTNIGNPGYFLGLYSGLNRACLWTVSMVPNDSTSTLATVASGSQNSTFAAAAGVYAGYTPKSPGGVQYIRLGHEFNISGWPWSVSTTSGAANSPANFITAYQNIVTAFRSVSSQFRFVWCPNSGNSPPDPATCYPGDAYVDVIAIDCYQEAQYNLTTFAQQSANNGRGVTWGYNFAQCLSGARSGAAKPFAFCEWGTSDPAQGSLTDAQGAQYISDMYAWIKGADQGNVARQVALQAWWDGGNGSGYNSTLEGNQYPLTGAMYRSTFGQADVAHP